MKSSRNGKDLFTMVNSAHITLIRKEEKRGYAPNSSGSVKFNGIPREGNPEIPIKSYRYQCREHMIRNGMWDLFSHHTPAIKRRSWKSFYINIDFPWTM